MNGRLNDATDVENRNVNFSQRQPTNYAIARERVEGQTLRFRQQHDQEATDNTRPEGALLLFLLRDKAMLFISLGRRFSRSKSVDSVPLHQI